MKFRIAYTALAALVVAVGGLAGCGGTPPEGDLPAAKGISQEESDKIAKQVQEGMRTSGYKGAPGAPKPK